VTEPTDESERPADAEAESAVGAAPEPTAGSAPPADVEAGPAVDAQPEPTAESAPAADVEAGPTLAAGAPSAPELRAVAAEDVLRYGVPVEMSCYLRGSFGPFPRRGRQGLLVLERGTATWRTGWLRRVTHQLPLAGAGVTERALRKGRRDPAPLFRLVEVTHPEGTLELTIPSADVPTFRVFLASLAS
jgi:hypothetical protein